MSIQWHQDDADLLLESINYTAAQTGFIPRLLEKDYFCSVVLEFLATNDDALTFKGGTCLSKIHSEFYRLSEDLDFSISTPLDSSRAQRREHSRRLKALIEHLPDALPGFKLIKPLQGANNSTQYVAVIGYASLLDEQLEPIRVEIGLREPHLTETVTGQAKTALLNPLDGQDLVDACPARCLSYQETVAEKLRAAVCRREIAIRDYFDVDYIVQNNEFNLWDDNLIALLKQKIAIPGTGAINLSEQRLAQLDKQLDAQFRPVLRANDFSSFELERATATVQRLIEHLE